MATSGTSKLAGAVIGSELPAAATNLRGASDDEILNLSPRALPKKKFARTAPDSEAAEPATINARGIAEAKDSRPAESSSIEVPDETVAVAPEEFRAALEEHPELRSAWQDVAAYRESFASPEQAREATRLVSDMNRLDALFFSARPEDHAQLARVVSELDPAAAASLAWALSRVAAEKPSVRNSTAENPGGGSGFSTKPATQRTEEVRSAVSPVQEEFFHGANAAAVEGVLDAIHAQVDQLLPQGTSQGARNRVVGEIYRELDTSLRSNRQLAEQLRQAFKSGALDAAHQRVIVSLITSRARQALPGVAKRVMNEWTAALVSSGADRRARQRAAESRVDIGGAGRSGAEGRRSLTPREIDYSRLSDADILNM